ncbi:type II secretion system minor pseudopilin GspH [Alcanivorax sp.]|uniref:type II secretion system minor pseudopilin GspH n=1 Tax=Alcanivorax sp. TaxID=1872427 RepID=UPI000C1010FF|nr:type II secretion system minor pseudopilin GspH [Alcanivorax sp.]PHR68005.1 MAG: type II secretion system protein GspH [Alcanivorax sp.]
MRLPRTLQSGFTLLEIMVVVGLIALLSAVVVSQGNWASDDRQLEQESARLKDTLSLLNERSLFSGQLLALRLRHDGWEPLAYDIAAADFLPIEDTALKPRQIPPALELVWQLDELADEEQASLSQVAETLVKKDTSLDLGEDTVGEGGEAEARQRDSNNESGEEGEDEKAFPQIFFFPSGEVSPVTLAMQSQDDLDQVQRWQISALGQITDPDREQDDDDQQDKQEWLEQRSRMIEDVQE